MNSTFSHVSIWKLDVLAVDDVTVRTYLNRDSLQSLFSERQLSLRFQLWLVSRTHPPHWHYLKLQSPPTRWPSMNIHERWRLHLQRGKSRVLTQLCASVLNCRWSVQATRSSSDKMPLWWLEVHQRQQQSLNFCNLQTVNHIGWLNDRDEMTWGVTDCWHSFYHAVLVLRPAEAFQMRVCVLLKVPKHLDRYWFLFWFAFR